MADKIKEKANKMRSMSDKELVAYVENRVEKARSEGFNKGYNLLEGLEVMVKIKIDYSALSDDIELQVNTQGYTLGNHADTVQNIADAINMCYLHSVITNGECRRARERLHVILINNIKKKET